MPLTMPRAPPFLNPEIAPKVPATTAPALATPLSTRSEVEVRGLWLNRPPAREFRPSSVRNGPPGTVPTDFPVCGSTTVSPTTGMRIPAPFPPLGENGVAPPPPVPWNSFVTAPMMPAVPVAAPRPASIPPTPPLAGVWNGPWPPPPRPVDRTPKVPVSGSHTFSYAPPPPPIGPDPVSPLVSLPKVPIPGMPLTPVPDAAAAASLAIDGAPPVPAPLHFWSVRSRLIVAWVLVAVSRVLFSVSWVARCCASLTGSAPNGVPAKILPNGLLLFCASGIRNASKMGLVAFWKIVLPVSFPMFLNRSPG